MSPIAETGIAFFARNMKHLLFQRNFSHCKACFLRQDSQEKILWILVHPLMKFQITFLKKKNTIQYGNAMVNIQIWAIQL